MTVSTGIRSGYWSGLNGSQRQELNRIGRASGFRAGSVVLAQRDRSGDVIFVHSGFVKVVVRDAHGQAVVLALRGPGDVLGEMASIDGGRRSGAVVAIDDVSGLVVPHVAFQDFLDHSPQASELLQRTLVERLREADRDRLAVGSMTVRQRLARLLLNLAGRYGVRTAEGITVGLLSQREFAGCIGGAHRSVTRQMSAWRDSGVISTGRRAVTIHRPLRLKLEVKALPGTVGADGMR